MRRRRPARFSTASTRETSSGSKLFVFAGSSDPRRGPIERRPRATLDLPATESVTVTASAGSEGAGVSAQRSSPLEAVDLDGDRKAEIVITFRDDQGRGRVTVGRWGG